MHPTILAPTAASTSDLRRLAPRLPTLALCSELAAGRDRPGFVIDLSPAGACIERPYVGGPTPRDIQLELELPDEDEVLWARGQVRFDEVRQDAHGNLLRRTGLALAACARDLKLLRDYVMDRQRAAALRESPTGMMFDASCYARG